MQHPREARADLATSLPLARQDFLGRAGDGG
jgi:hypothetical protein